MTSFTSEEKRLLISALNAYPETPELSPLVKQALEKLTLDNTLPDAYTYFSGIVKSMVTSINGGEEVQIAPLGPDNFPVFKFIKCPKMLPMKDVFGIEEQFQWSPTYRFTYDPELHEIHITNIKDPTNPLVLPLGIFEMEALFAFYIYHIMSEKGVEQSGLIPSAPEQAESKTTSNPAEEKK